MGRRFGQVFGFARQIIALNAPFALGKTLKATVHQHLESEYRDWPRPPEP